VIFSSSYGNIYYEITGQGEPLLLLHGTPFSSLVWKDIKVKLHDRFQVYTFDLLGYGRSEKAQRVSLDVQNKVLCELLDHWGLQQPNAVAHDFGGATLLRSMIIDGRVYRKIMLIDVVALSPWGSPFVQHVRDHENVFAGIPDYIHKAMVEAYIKDALYTDVSEKDIQYLVEPWLGKEGKEAFYRQIAQMDPSYTVELEEHYGNLNCPTRILWGEKDNWIPLSLGRKLHDMIPQSSFLNVPDSNHLMQIDQPGIIIDEIRTYF